MPTVAVTTEPLLNADGPHIEMLRKEGFELQYPEDPHVATDEDTIAAVRGAEAVIAGGEPYSDHVLVRSPDLRVISRYGVGFDRVDVEAATRRNVAVTITPTGNHEAVAEHTFALLMAVTRCIALGDRQIRNGVWQRRRFVPLRGRTLGIVGFGRVGRSVAVRGATFGMRVLAHDKYVDASVGLDLGVERVAFHALLAASDVITLHAPLTPETRGLIDRGAIARMRPGSILVNTARGPLVVENDLVDALRSGHLAGAGLDVFAEEPVSRSHPLLTLDNVVVSPHVAANDTKALHDMAIEAAQNVIDLYRGRRPVGSCLNPAILEGWTW